MTWELSFFRAQSVFLVALFMAFTDSMAAKQGRRSQHSEESCESTWLKAASEEVRSPSLTSLHMPGRWRRTRWHGTTLAPPHGANLLSRWPPAQPPVLTVVGAWEQGGCQEQRGLSSSIHPPGRGMGPRLPLQLRWAVSVSQVAQPSSSASCSGHFVDWGMGGAAALLYFRVIDLKHHHYF